MIILANPNNSPFSVQYVQNDKVFRKEVLPNTISAFKGLTTLFQIKNEAALTGNNITIFDYTNNSYVNRGSFVNGYRGTTTATGMTLTTDLLAVPTGYTFITSAATTGVALNSATATSVGNSIRVAYSGAAVSTTTWLNAINTTLFSGFGFTISGHSTTTYISSGAAQTFTVSANTASSNFNNAVFVGNDVKRSDYNVYNPFDLNATYASLSALTIS